MPSSTILNQHSLKSYSKPNHKLSRFSSQPENALKATLVLLPDTNHVLKTVISGDRNANLATYFDSGLPPAPGVIDAMTGFLASEANVAR